MDPKQLAALQLYTGAIFAHRFLHSPLALHPDAFAITPSAHSWTSRQAHELASQLQHAFDQVRAAGVPS
jgi:hypothetical protein